MIKLASEFRKRIDDRLNMTEKWVDEFFDISEDKQGFFVAKLNPKSNLDLTQFKDMCSLVRELGGPDYVQGSKLWKVPSPCVRAPSLAEPAKTAKAQLPNIQFIPVDAIRVPAFLPTRELIRHERIAEIRDSIKNHGLKYAIKVRRASDGGYELIDGFVRKKAVEELDWKQVPAEIVEASDETVIVDSIITNKDRIEEDPVTLAKKIDVLLNAFGWTQEKLAEQLTMDRTSIAQHVRILQLPEEVQHSVALHNVSFYQGLLLLELEGAQTQLLLAKEVKEKGLSTRQLEERIRKLKPPKPKIEEKPRPLPETEVVPETWSFRNKREEMMKPETGPDVLKPEEKAGIEIGVIECSECSSKFRLVHLSTNLHRIRKIEAEAKS
jgi:ParB family chromosome partitioning protein